MANLILNFRLDATAFAILLCAATMLCHWWLRGRVGRGIPPMGWLALTVLVAAGYISSEISGENERRHLRDMIAGIAPTYAEELELSGHSQITLDTPADDPRYLAMIAAQGRWERANVNVSDVYTMRRDANGDPYFVVDAETDYDRNGKYEGERESRTAIGEPYDEMPPGMLSTFEGTAGFDDVPVTDRWGTWVSAYAPLRDAAGNVEALVGVDYDAHSWLTAILWSRIAVLGFIAVVSVVLLASTIVVLMSRAELLARVAAEREREKLQAQLVTASRHAGMAEVATSVLHNVGNVLNSVNVSAALVHTQLEKSAVGDLQKVGQMIGEQGDGFGQFVTNDPRGRMLPSFLVALAEQLAEERREMLGEVDNLVMNINHIKSVVSMQQAYAGRSSVTEPVILSELMEDALRMNADSLSRHHVRIERDYDRSIPQVTIDRHKVLQILVNLMTNAKQAMDESPDDRRTLTVRIARDPNDRILLQVIDTGRGIAPEHLGQIFQHGFTTKPDGHGFGLHSGALAAQEMGGRIHAASDGLGHGATFTLELPFARVMREAA